MIWSLCINLFCSHSPSSLNVSNRSLNVSNRSLNVTSRTQAVAESANYILENYGTSLPVAVIELIGSSESNAFSVSIWFTKLNFVFSMSQENHNAVSIYQAADGHGLWVGASSWFGSTLNLVGTLHPLRWRNPLPSVHQNHLNWHYHQVTWRTKPV